MSNPFLYGEEVTGEYFCNRKKEIQQLLEYINNTNKILLYSPRRWGKTSLIKEVLSRLPQKSYITLYVDLYPVSNEEEFIQTVANAFAKTFTGSLDKIVRTLKSLLSSFIPKVSISSTGETSLEFGLDSSKNKFLLVEELMDTLSQYIKKKKRKGVIIFDEFQQIGEMPTDRLEKILRSHIQKHRHIAYLFAGSKRHLLSKMFSDPSGPFYKSAIHFPLGPMEKSELQAFVIKRFEAAKFKIADEVAAYILTISKSHPYHTQQLCFHICNLAKPFQQITKDLVGEAKERILLEENASYQNVFDLLSRGQSDAVRALAKLLPEETPFSAAFIKRVGLPSADALRKGLESLVEKNIVEKIDGSYHISDIFFSEWLSRLS